MARRRMEASTPMEMNRRANQIRNTQWKKYISTHTHRAIEYKNVYEKESDRKRKLTNRSNDNQWEEMNLFEEKHELLWLSERERGKI